MLIFRNHLGLLPRSPVSTSLILLQPRKHLCPWREELSGWGHDDYHGNKRKYDE